jgi:NAD(P)-dependent dehydrogenase (short-subunit alcohol dehydrogenase family)
MKVHNKVIVVTGGESGMGRELVLMLSLTIHPHSKP